MITLTTALLILLPLSLLALCEKRATARHLRALKASADARMEEAYANHDRYHEMKWLRTYTAYPL